MALDVEGRPHVLIAGRLFDEATAQALLDLAERGQREDFQWLALAFGADVLRLDTLWVAAREHVLRRPTPRAADQDDDDADT